jgi:cytochrome c2
VHTGALGALLAFSRTLWYPAYAGGAATWGLTPLEDQQLAGLIMWIPGTAAYLVAALMLFGSWLRESEGTLPLGTLPLGKRPQREASPLRSPSGSPLALGLVLILAASAAVGVTACSRSDAATYALTGGNAARAPALIRAYGCGTCHTIPGVRGATAHVGPPLGGIAGRSYIGGVLANNPENLVRWIENPPAVDDKTAMPNLHVGHGDAADIAAYLYTLR